MKRIYCEMCNSNDLIKEGDIYVCQACGCKYSVEAARSLLRDEDTVDVNVTNVVRTVDDSLFNNLIDEIMLRIDMKEWTKAEELCKKCIEEYPARPEGYYHITKCYISESQLTSEMYSLDFDFSVQLDTWEKKKGITGYVLNAVSTKDGKKKELSASYEDIDCCLKACDAFTKLQFIIGRLSDKEKYGYMSEEFKERFTDNTRKTMAEYKENIKDINRKNRAVLGFRKKLFTVLAIILIIGVICTIALICISGLKEAALVSIMAVLIVTMVFLVLFMIWR